MAEAAETDDKEDKDYEPYPSFKMDKHRKSKRLEKEVHENSSIFLKVGPIAKTKWMQRSACLFLNIYNIVDTDSLKKMCTDTQNATVSLCLCTLMWIASFEKIFHGLNDLFCCCCCWMVQAVCH